MIPKDLIALKPASPRDTSRLFIYHTATDTISFDRFYNLDKYLPQDAFLVMNNTKVVPARLTLQKETGGKVIALLLVNELQPEDQTVKAFIDRKVTVGDKLSVVGDSFTVLKQDGHIFTLKFSMSQKQLFEILEKQGSMPIPLYLKHSPLSNAQLRQKYQTLFGQYSGSSVAPTASLHFTKRLFKKLDQKGIERLLVTLHVGLGTFAPVTEEAMKSSRLHKEYYEITSNVRFQMSDFRSQSKKLIAVGTTVVRTLESFARSGIQRGSTDLFIKPPYQFKMIDGMITNFHLPDSSLIMLVDAFLQHKRARRGAGELYKIAVSEQFRFYSFGDAMLIL